MISFLAIPKVDKYFLTKVNSCGFLFWKRLMLSFTEDTSTY